MRERCWVALDEAGYDVEPEPEPIDIPAESGIQGRIIGRSPQRKRRGAAKRLLPPDIVG